MFLSSSADTGSAFCMCPSVDLHLSHPKRGIDNVLLILSPQPAAGPPCLILVARSGEDGYTPGGVVELLQGGVLGVVADVFGATLARPPGSQA
jgi:hypothetical protein